MPENAATAAMYAYTPHLHGNQLFTTLWDKYFSVTYPTGTLLQAAGDTTVYLIEYGYKRPINSWSALLSRFNPDLIIETTDSQLANYPDGRSIDFPNYSLLEDDDGQRYLLVDDMLRPFEDNSVFSQIGFVEDELEPIGNADVDRFDTGSTITLKTQDATGSLLQLTTNGAIFFVQDGYRHAVLDETVLNASFPNATLTPAAPVEVEQFRPSKAVLMPDGWLVKGSVDPNVFVISEGAKRPIEDEAAFLGLGYEWGDIVTVAQDVLDIHPTGNVIENQSANGENSIASN